MIDDRLSILVIEDDRDTRENLCEILQMDGHQVFSAGCFKESREIATSNPIGLVLTDRRLPEGMIEDLLIDMMSDSGDAEVIVVTGLGDMQSTIAALRLGVSDYLIKPVIPDDLRSIVNRVAEKRSLKSRLEHEEAFANEMLNTTEAIVLVLDLDGNVLRFNPFFEQLTAWTLDELRGKNWFDVCVPSQERARTQEIFDKTSRNIKTRGIVNEVCGKNGRCYRIRWSNTLLRSTDGTPEAVLAAGVDITDLVNAQARALRVERLAAIGQTMTALAHESRNALQRIKAATDVMELEVQGNESAKEELLAIRRATRDMELLHDEVRSYASPIYLEPTPTLLPNVWRRIWSDLRSVLAGRAAELIESAESCDVTIEIDAVRIGQVFRNLFENSLAACAGFARVEIDCRCVGEDIELRFRDNGPGMDEKLRLNAFDAFYTTKKSGTGLGLSICRRIVEAHGGKIEAVECDSGACFVLRLPRRQSD